MPLKDICRDKLVCIEPRATVLDAARLMADRHVGDVVVVNDPERPREPLGILTDRDIVTKVISKGLRPEETLVEHVMLTPLRLARETDGVFAATETLENAAVRRLPIVDGNGHITGILSIDDFYELLATEIGNLSRISARQAAFESGAFSRG